MAPRRRSHIVASRRRVEDEGEDDGSIGEELEDDSLSEGTPISNQDDDADGEGSDFSENDISGSPGINRSNGQLRADVQGGKFTPPKNIFASTLPDTEAMLNGLRISGEGGEVAEIHFDDMTEELDAAAAASRTADVKDPRRETFAERKRREHEEYIRERDTNPAFVPTRGGFFLHDKRSTDSPPNGYRSFNKPKTRPHGLIVDGNAGRRSLQKPDVTEGPWTHDLHDSVVQGHRPTPDLPPPVVLPDPPPQLSRPVPTAPRSSPPNRSFSSTVLVGNVPVVVFLPGMANPIPYSAVPKKQHTRLPHHRPPLRRDKPVRISLPGQPPRYIFPATERSFIFIPRALRPNQQAYHRGRGRGGFYPSRRTSVYGGSTYTPSVAMSRRSSLGRGASRDGVNSPAGSVMSRPGVVPADGGKPVVRLPPTIRIPIGAGPPLPNLPPHVAPPPANVPQPSPYPLPQHPSFRENRSTPSIPMYQPRPQKAVSVADIESPVTFAFNPPQQQQEQPFHHQVPLQVNGHGFMPESSIYSPNTRHTSHPSQASATPLSQIPERAIHAQPFQPFPFQQPQGYYPPTAYPPGPLYYPVTNAEYPTYSTSIPPGHAPTFIPPAQQISYAISSSQTSNEQPTQAGTVAHESNGTVYYYDTSQFANPSYATNPPFPVGPQGGVVGMGGMMTPPGTTYYYHQPQNGGVYYT